MAPSSFLGRSALVLSAALLAACASSSGATPPKSPEPTPVTAGTTADPGPSTGSGGNGGMSTNPASDTGPVVCDLVCERAKVERRSTDDPDYHAQATNNANDVIGKMTPDLLACYKKRVAVNPAAHGFITVDIVIGPDGKVTKVETTGGAVLGEATLNCMVQRIKQGSFAPPHGGGTLRISVPFSLRRVAAGEDA